MKIQYCMFESREYSEEEGEYQAFGICAMRDGSCAARIADISLDRDFVLQLAQRCTQSELALDHLLDVVEDALEVW